MTKPQVKKEHYNRRKYDNLERFISYFYQIDLVRLLNPASVLEIGKGNGTVSDYLKKLGLDVVTIDIDKDLRPDHVGDVRNIPLKDNSFDVVVAYEVLEHLPYEDFKYALREIKRVSKKDVIISLPYRSSGIELVFKFPLIRTLFKKSFLDLFLRIPLSFGGLKTSGQHHWEIDRQKYSLQKVRRVIKKHFKIVKEIRPALNYYHYFFVLKK